MEHPLFRRGATFGHEDKLHGDVIIKPRGFYIIGVSILFSWVACVIAWLFLSDYKSKETVSGWLEPAEGIVRLFPEVSQGNIKEILVREGQRVSKGDILVVISNDNSVSSGDTLAQTILVEYQSQQKLLTNRIARSQEIFSAQKKGVAKEIEAAKNELKQIQEQLVTLKKLHKMSVSKVEQYQSLIQNNYISRELLNTTIEQELALENEVKSTLRVQLAQKGHLDKLKAKYELLPQENQNQLDQLNYELSEVVLRTKQFSSQNSRIIRASIDGTIYNLKARIGHQVNPSVPLLSIMPNDYLLTVQLLVPVRAAGFIAIDQSVVLRYDAFPHQKFGLYSGKVSQISNAILLPSEVPNSLVHIEEPVYLIEATLDKNTITAFGKSIQLKPGITLTADIEVSSRTLIEWLLEPILSLHGRL